MNLNVFPKEITEKAHWYGCYHEESGEYTEPGDTIEAALCGYCEWLDTDLYVLFDEVVEAEVVAYGENHKELARVRVRLSLNIEILEAL